MDVTFDDVKLERLVASAGQLRRKYGDKQATRIQTRVTALRAATCVDDLRPPLPGRWHELTANWTEHWSGDLDHPYRLIVRPVEPVPRKDDGGVDWTAVTSVAVVGIVDTH